MDDFVIRSFDCLALGFLAAQGVLPGPSLGWMLGVNAVRDLKLEVY